MRSLLIACLIGSPLAAASTEDQLLAEWAKAPHTHSHLPDFSYAGYRTSEVPLPEPKASVNVRALGAIGDGQADDTAAFTKAIAAVSERGGAITVPKGTYRISGILTIDAPGVVLRGEDRDQTILAFQNHIEAIKGVDRVKSRWSWQGGLIWVAPKADTPSAAFAVRPIAPTAQGSLTLTVGNGGGAMPKAGDWAVVRWTGDLGLAHAIAGHPSMAGYDWKSFDDTKDGRTTFTWPVRITAVKGAAVTIAKPLRLPAQAPWTVTLEPAPAMITEVGIERMTLRMPPHVSPGHNKDQGWNGIFLRRAADCWVRDVTITDFDNGVIIDGSTQCTVTGLRLAQGANHHGTMCRDGSHDNLIQDFRIESKPMHGINTEGWSSGNVWRRGVMLHGTFDSHCAMSFDSLRTDIEVNSDGRPGGAGWAGPFVGRRMVHWNIRMTGGESEWLFCPAYLPSGLIVGGQGAPVNPKDRDLWHMPPGEKGCLVVGHGKAPMVKDLFQYQLDRRLTAGKRPTK
jgi:hypothetical protein